MSLFEMGAYSSWARRWGKTMNMPSGLISRRLPPQPEMRQSGSRQLGCADGICKLLMQLILTGVWPLATIILCVTNDFVWWIPFALYLYDSWPNFRQTLGDKLFPPS